MIYHDHTYDLNRNERINGTQGTINSEPQINNNSIVIYFMILIISDRFTIYSFTNIFLQL